MCSSDLFPSHDTSGGNFSRQDLAYANRTKKHVLIDPVTGDRYVGIRTCTLGLGVFKVDEEGKILQEYSREEFYKLGVVDRLVKQLLTGFCESPV